MPPTLEPNLVIHNRFIIEKEIGKGGFGNVYVAIDQETKARVALKISEPANYDKGFVRGAMFGDLELEYKVLVHINEGTSTGNFPRPHFFGKYGEYPFITMDFLGPSLKTLMGPNSSVPLKAILFLMDQSIWNLEVLHSKGIIHRDLKPGNIVIGTEENRNKIYLIDFGLASIYRTAEEHLPEKDVDLVLGTPAFMPINGHLKMQQGRRDDLESLAYVALSLLTHENLPWRDIKAANLVQREEKIKQEKEMTPEKLFSGFPQEFAEFLKAVRNLSFDEKPKYMAYRRMFRLLGYCLDVNYEDPHDWSQQ